MSASSPPPVPDTPRAWSADDLRDNPHERGDKAERVRTMFDAIARRYDLNNRVHSFGRDQAWRRAAVRAARVTATDRVLDVACGTGDLTESFARVRPRSVIGVDFAARMLDRARVKSTRRAVRPPGEPTPTYEQGDAMALRFEDGSFDIVSIAFGIRNVEEPARALAEFHRVLAPGGRLVILEFGEPRQPLIRMLNRLYTCRIMPVTAAWLARDRSGAYRYLPRSIATFLDPAALAAAIRVAGFDSVETRPLTFGVCQAHIARRT